jgi:hypothetical protein
MVKTPSVLKWMINRRAKLLGEIKKTEKRFDSRVLDIQQELNIIERRAPILRNRLDRAQNLRPQILAALRHDLAVIDSAMSQHEVMIDIDLIKPQKSQDNAYFLPPGSMSRLILKALREAGGETLCTTEVALFVAMEGKLEIDADDFVTFKIAIRSRMRALHTSGHLKRVEIGRHHVESRWRALKPSELAPSPRDVT